MDNISKSPSFSDNRNQSLMSFSKALDRLVEGYDVRRMEWDDKETYFTMRDEKLMIYKPESKQFHPLILTVADITATDWVVINPVSITN